MDLLDIVHRYFHHPVTREQVLADRKIFDRLQDTPRYQAWRAVRKVAWDKRADWKSLVKGLKPQLPGFSLRNESMPGMSCYEAGAYIVKPDDPENKKPPDQGEILVSLIVRVSFFAPLYEMYETHSKVTYEKSWVDEDGREWHTYEYHRRTHDIGPKYRPAADAFARAIEAQYGYERANPDVLNIQLLNTAMWEDRWYTGTLRDALFSEYRF